jgi:hypothetical protein
MVDYESKILGFVFAENHLSSSQPVLTSKLVTPTTQTRRGHHVRHPAWLVPGPEFLQVPNPELDAL